MYSPSTGRFDTLDPFYGNLQDPQSFHKYGYVHGDPVNAVDPTGQFAALIGAMVGFGIRSNFEVKSAPVYGAAIGFTFDVLLAANILFLRNTSSWLYPKGTFIPIQKEHLESHYHSVRIQGSLKSADQLFAKMSRFTELDTYPSKALQNATAIGDTVTWDMSPIFLDFGQADFSVKVTKLDAMNRFFVVRTLSRHPLAGYRIWRVNELPGGDVQIETFSVEHPITVIDRLKIHGMAGQGLKGMYKTWTNMLNDLASFSGGTVVHGDGTVLNGEDRTSQVAFYLPQVE